MTLTSLAKEAGINRLGDPLPLELPEEALEAAGARLKKHIREDTITVKVIDSYIKKNLDSLAEPQRTDVLEFLLSKKAQLSFQQGRTDDGLRLCDEALRVKETASAWALKASVLFHLERVDEAFEAFHKAFDLEGRIGPQKNEYLQDIVAFWSGAALLLGISGILDNDQQAAETGAHEYINVSENAAQANISQAIIKPASLGQIPKPFAEGFEEFELMVRLLTIKDPFDRMRAMIPIISKDWPEGLSAVDAIREVRR